MAGELRLNEVATPSAQAAGKDGIFVSNETLPRLRRIDSAGTVWPSAEIFMTSLASDYTLADSNTAQKAFNASTNGAITLPASSSYLLEATYMITNTGTTSHTWGVLFAGTATITALDFTVTGRTGVTSQATLTAVTSASQSNGSGSLPSTNLVATAASVSATENVLLDIKGTLRINASGTFIPQIKLSAATTVAATMKRGSFIRLTPFGADTAAVLGNWS